jgi:hypothetical protein
MLGVEVQEDLCRGQVVKADFHIAAIRPAQAAVRASFESHLSRRKDPCGKTAVRGQIRSLDPHHQVQRRIREFAIQKLVREAALYSFDVALQFRLGFGPQIPFFCARADSIS